MALITQTTKLPMRKINVKNWKWNKLYVYRGRTVSGVWRRPEDVDLPETDQRPTSTPTATTTHCTRSGKRDDTGSANGIRKGTLEPGTGSSRNERHGAGAAAARAEETTDSAAVLTDGDITPVRPTTLSVKLHQTTLLFTAFVHHSYLDYYLRRLQLLTARLLSFAGLNYTRLLSFTVLQN